VLDRPGLAWLLYSDEITEAIRRIFEAIAEHGPWVNTPVHHGRPMRSPKKRSLAKPSTNLPKFS
jgi:hypothetical protein